MADSEREEKEEKKLKRRLTMSSVEDEILRSSIGRKLVKGRMGRFMTDGNLSRFLRPDVTEAAGDEDELVTACQEVLRSLETGKVSAGDVEEAKTKVQEKLSERQSTELPGPTSMAAVHKRMKRRSQRDRARLDQYASQVMDLDSSGESFVQRMHRLFAEAGGHLPSVTIEYCGVEIEADAQIGKDAVPSLTKALWNFLKGVTRLEKLTSNLAPLRTLTISGKLKPGRLTLLMGPPDSGKTLFLQMLAGRLYKSKHLRKRGEIRYNGHSRREFNMARTVALVDQIDQHIANLTVRETLEFAYICQNGYNPKDLFDPVEELRKARAANGGKWEDEHTKTEAVLDTALQVHDKDSANLEDGCNAKEGDKTAKKTNGTESQDSSQEGHKGVKGKQKDEDKPGNTAAGSSDAEFEKLLTEVWRTEVRLEILLRTLGLSSAADTLIGDAVVRGVSGGERKRVTSAEMLVGPKRVLLMDEISTGLDSATTYTVTEFLRHTTHYLHLTTLVSLLQPPPEVFFLFEDIILLSDGLLMFHGPVKQAVPFFEQLGFICPERKDHASFLQEVTTAKGQLLYASPELRAAKGLGNAARLDQYRGRLIMPVQHIAEAYWSTQWGRAMREELKSQRFDKKDSHPAALPQRPYALSWWEAVHVLMERQWKLTVRDAGLVRGRVIQVAVVGLIVGSLFSNQQPVPSDARNFFGVSFIAIMFLSFGAQPELSICFDMKPVLFKQRDNRFYPPSAWSLAMMLVRVPFQLVEAFIFAGIIYFWVGFYKSAGCFFTFYLICVGSMLQMSAIYRLMAAASPNMDIASAAGGVVLLLLIVFSGYAIIRTAVPPWWIWAYWLSPFTWNMQAMAINEMTTPPWGPSGKEALESFGFYTHRFWIWAGICYNFCIVLLLTALVGLALTFLSPPKGRPTTPADEVIMRNEAHQEAVKRSRTSRRLKVSARLDSVASQGSQGSRPVSSRQLSLRQFTRTISHAASRRSSRRGSGDVPDLQDADDVEDPKHDDIASGLPFRPITLVYHHLQYFVPLPGKKKVDGSGKRQRLELLKDISGATVPGQLTALIGGSGAGKTTLMDVIAGRKTQGEIRGDILVNGFPKVQETWARVVGYVEQMDIHSPQVLVVEALQLSARLRLPGSIPSSEVREFVKDVMDIVELTPLRQTLVGIPGQSGLSVEQRKRLTIAVELVANPSVIFMDEPTSGLDARAAMIVMQSIKNVSRNGRTVMVTIHQPSIDIFETFDALVLLRRGGTLIYSGLVGEQSSALIEYLEGVPGVQPIRSGENPATWMLEVTGGASVTGKSKAAKVDFAEYYKESELYQENEELIKHLIKQGREEDAELKVSGKYATSRFTQLVALARKFRLAYWRSPSYNLMRMLMTLLISLFYGSVFWRRGQLPSQGITISNIQNVMGVLYSSSNYQGMFNLQNVLPVVGYERSVFYRERASKMYARASYITAVGFVELPYIVAQTIVFVPVAYFMVGFNLSAASFLYFTLVFFLNLCVFTYFGQFLVFLTPSQGMANIVASAVQSLWSIFNGFLIPYPATPKGWRWLNRLSPSTWVIYGLSVDQLGQNHEMMTAPGGEQQTVAEFLKSYFGYEYSQRWTCVLVLVAYVLVFRLGSMLTVRFINYQKR